jgi:hypothetical protein
MRLRQSRTECRWEHEGTFGVLPSMSGFAKSVNETASQGNRLNCIGMTFRELIDVLEGHQTFAGLVRAARGTASTRNLFFDR